VFECSKYECEREALMNVVYEQYGVVQWYVRSTEDDLGLSYLVGLDEECNLRVVDAMKNFLVKAWRKRH
jgi:hypothetical protein